MVNCKHCQTANSLDSTFCKRCGASIDAQDLTEASVKLDKLVEEGNLLFNQGRTEEAVAIADLAVATNPTSVTGHSLKTLCHERRGEYAQALESADRLVELNPDSEFDKIRRNAIRQKLQTDLHLPPAPDRKLALVGSISAVVLVICLGAIWARATQSSHASPSPDTRLTALDTGNSTTAKPPVDTSSPASSAPTTDQNLPSVVQPDPNPVTQPPVTQDRSTAPATAYRSVNPGTVADNRLPTVQGQGDLVTVEPIHPTVPDPGPSFQKLQPKGTDSDAGKSDPAPKPTTTSAPPTTLPETPVDRGEIKINIHPGGETRRSVGDSMGHTGLEALVRVGSQQFQLGNYAAAAKSYEQALKNGGDEIILSRRLGQAYENLGRMSDAAESYRRCIGAVDSALSSGKGNRDRLSSTRDLCQQALRVIGG